MIALAMIHKVAVVLGLLMASLSLGVIWSGRRHRYGWMSAFMVSWVVMAVLIFGAVYPHSQLFGKALWRGDPRRPEIALTFDDGPNPECTRKLLHILSRQQVKATFFVIGRNVAAHPDIVRQIADDGHCIGNHTYTHPDLLTKSSRQVRVEICRTEGAIFQATGRSVTPLFRPPCGFLTPLVTRECRRLGYRVVRWEISGRDWNNPSPERIQRAVLRRVRAGAIILLHDRRHTVQALPGILRILRERGFRLVTVPELVGQDVMVGSPSLSEPAHRR